MYTMTAEECNKLFARAGMPEDAVPNQITPWKQIIEAIITIAKREALEEIRKELHG